MRNNVLDQPVESLVEELLKSKSNELVLFNDADNTFDWVIECLMKICNHTPEQAEQSAMITHYNGKCIIKTDEIKVLTVMCSMLLDCGLKVEIQ